MSGIAGSFMLVNSGLSVAAPGWWPGISSLNFGLHLEHVHLICFCCFFAGPDSVSPLSCSGEVIYWLHYLQNSISLKGALFFQKYYRVGKQFWLSFCCINVFVGIVVVIVLVQGWKIRATIFVSSNNLRTFNLFFLYFQLTTLISVMIRFFTVVVRQFGSVGIRFCGMLAHNVHFHLIGTVHLNHSALILFRGVWQSVHMCLFPKKPDFFTLSNVVAIWRIKIVQ